MVQTFVRRGVPLSAPIKTPPPSRGRAGWGSFGRRSRPSLGGRRVSLSALGVFLVGVTVAARAGAVSMHYDITVRPPPDRRVEVRARFDGLDPDESVLKLKMEEKYAFVRLDEPLLDGPVRASASGNPLTIERTGPYAWKLKPAGNTSVELRYSVPITHRELEAVQGRHAYEYPFITDDHALLATAVMVIYPEDVRSGELRVRLNVPDGWKVFAPWRCLPSGEFEPPSRSSLHNDMLAVGNWSGHEIRVGDFVGNVAFAPGQSEVEDQVADAIKRIVEYELRLFDRPAKGNYLFLFGPPLERSMGGSPKTASMILGIDPQLIQHGGHGIGHLIAHEFFHTWASAEAHIPDELRWLNEGITDYYAYLVCARLGLISWEQFAATLAEKMQVANNCRHHGRMSLADAGGDVFFVDPTVSELVYDGGMVVGAWMDRAIRAEGKGKSLDDFMRALINDPRWDPDEHGPTQEDWAALLPKFVSPETAENMVAAVREPYTLDPVAVFAPLGVAVERRSAPPSLDLRANLDGTRVINMDHSGLIYKVGVRENDRFVEVNGVEVDDHFAVRRAWQNPQEGRMRVKLLRGDQTVEIDEALVEVVSFEVPADPWRAHAH